MASLRGFTSEFNAFFAVASLGDEYIFNPSVQITPPGGRPLLAGVASSSSVPNYLRAEGHCSQRAYMLLSTAPFDVVARSTHVRVRSTWFSDTTGVDYA